MKHTRNLRSRHQSSMTRRRRPCQGGDSRRIHSHGLRSGRFSDLRFTRGYIPAPLRGDVHAVGGE